MYTIDEIETVKKEVKKRIETCRIQGDSSLDLSKLELNRLGENRLVELMREIPKNVTILSLTNNVL
ncbi:hypothetical protein [Legionella waltersii]|uniref:Leucine-rich repeat-containing protein n=1 Tax=Legionella waltersii TaxID=66969 RepID=A0A0W1AK81_9GAMM|nr:hypothetical protein [Legionella waltersii]KTD81749.1 hypothetical protein Lwal_1001 [Legionella waltersii]SNU97064.1 Uncharacterised protein [Legionella waltersii]